MTDKIFSVSCPLRRVTAHILPQMELLEPPLVLGTPLLNAITARQTTTVCSGAAPYFRLWKNTPQQPMCARGRHKSCQQLVHVLYEETDCLQRTTRRRAMVAFSEMMLQSSMSVVLAMIHSLSLSLSLCDVVMNRAGNKSSGDSSSRTSLDPPWRQWRDTTGLWRGLA